MTKLKIWHAGETSEALCEHCDAWRATVFQYRPVRLRKGNVDVPDVLVAVCMTCDRIAAIPQQSAPRLREARKKEAARVDARISRELRDVVGVIALEYGAELESFAGGVVRYYLNEIRRDEVLARRIVKLAGSRDATRGTPGARLAFRTERSLLTEALTIVSRTRKTDKSELVRGIIVAAKQDTYDIPNHRRRMALQAIAAAAGA